MVGREEAGRRYLTSIHNLRRVLSREMDAIQLGQQPCDEVDAAIARAQDARRGYETTFLVGAQEAGRAADTAPPPGT